MPLFFAIEASPLVHQFLFVGVGKVAAEATHREVHGYGGQRGVSWAVTPPPVVVAGCEALLAAGKGWGRDLHLFVPVEGPPFGPLLAIRPMSAAWGFCRIF